MTLLRARKSYTKPCPVRPRPRTTTAMPIQRMVQRQISPLKSRMGLRVSSVAKIPHETPWISRVKPSLVVPLSHALQRVGG